MSQMTLKIKKVGMKNPKTKVLGFASRAIANGTQEFSEDGFFVVEKDTDDVRCWCRVDEVKEAHIDHYSIGWFASHLCVSEEYIEKYANSERKVYLWKIGKVIALDCLKRDSLIVDKNPQQFAYCPLSYGESY